MSYRNKTYVAFASENIRSYYMMKAWKDNDKIEFDFYDAHDLFQARDSCLPETIKARLRERLKNAKQVVLLGSADGRRKGGDGTSFLAHEIKVIQEFDLPIVVANLDGDRKVDRNFIPKPLLDANYYTVSVSFQPAIIKYALDRYVPKYPGKKGEGPHEYPASVYEDLGL
ncbi:TIR domain-containing protein [Xanthomonas phaseoli]|uniref:TIR domain-containing protein n=1 Tax=Xanthomonas phaseoli TaxID=1985254 RepID=UPI001237D413|nr:TIR domain-containing protein [Xanthomonas phaseoli]MBO9834195.1 hypothetical protein [Xanthomonas phaseoli pv. dieffenbachiae]MBO9838816.1 hypothetical protein [Xanthomonas phaseoli pv. dieffenbachiae]MBO9842779.1 hypothetical protein [Xanthomonas phaseoli pv. dieffenbachiae]MBO9862085.1 hypothetical protein [Xanthomonas phaseoli pv. dieffenbachiae]MBO9867460.1 hypothetical protein [Xanthomonas phaseoli pv. dieffenbachiae]